jgi:hypothetical protein
MCRQRNYTSLGEEPLNRIGNNAPVTHTMLRIIPAPQPGRKALRTMGTEESIHSLVSVVRNKLWIDYCFRIA